MSNNLPIEAEEATYNEGFAFVLEDVRKEPEGLVLQRAKILFGVAPLDFPRFQANIRAVVGRDVRTRQPIVANATVPIQATSLEDAFIKMPTIIEKAGQELVQAARKEISKPKIVLPGSVKNSNPNGNPNLRFDPNV